MKLNSPDPMDGYDDEIMEEEDMVYYEDLEEVLEEDLAAEGGEEDDLNEEDINTASASNEEIHDDSRLQFTAHSKGVFCGSFDSEGALCVTGGEDDRALVWNTLTGDVVCECTEHEDSVVAAAFSFDGAYLATADMAGLVVVRKRPSWETVWQYQMGDLSWGFWHAAAHVLICGATTSEVYVWKIPSGETKVLQGHSKQASCGALLRDGKRLVVGYDDGSLKVWDLKTGSAVHHIIPPDDEQVPVNNLDTFHDNNLIVAGYISGKVLFIKSNTGKIVGNVSLESAIETVKFSKDPALGLLAIGSLEGTLTIWDVGRQAIRHTLMTKQEGDPNGITTVVWVDNYLAVACINGDIKIFDAKMGHALKTMTGHRAEILDLAYSQSAKALLSTSEDTVCRIFDFDVTQL